MPKVKNATPAHTVVFVGENAETLRNPRDLIADHVEKAKRVQNSHTPVLSEHVDTGIRIISDAKCQFLVVFDSELPFAATTPAVNVTCVRMIDDPAERLSK